MLMIMMITLLVANPITATTACCHNFDNALPGNKWILLHFRQLCRLVGKFTLLSSLKPICNLFRLKCLWTALELVGSFNWAHCKSVAFAFAMIVVMVDDTFIFYLHQSSFIMIILCCSIVYTSFSLILKLNFAASVASTLAGWW